MNFKSIFSDPTDNELEKSLHKSHNVDLVWCVIVAFVLIPITFFTLGQESSLYKFFDKLGLMFLAMAISNYFSYKRVKNYRLAQEKKNKEKEKNETTNSI